MSPIVYAIESHEQALGIWRDLKLRNAKLLHIDFHCDQRGLLVNRKTDRAYEIWTRFPQVDEGNFLKHAVLEGIIGSTRWVHDEPGGRSADIKSIKYESDVSALMHLAAIAIRRQPGIPYRYEVMRSEDWDGIHPGEILDIDWDYFAALEYSEKSIQRRIKEFLDRDFGSTPDTTIVCYSPEYSHPTRDLFADFVDTLSARFGADIVEIPRPAATESTSRLKSILRPVYHPARQLYHATNLTLRRCGIY